MVAVPVLLLVKTEAVKSLSCFFIFLLHKVYRFYVNNHLYTTEMTNIKNYLTYSCVIILNKLFHNYSLSVFWTFFLWACWWERSIGFWNLFGPGL